MNELAEFLRLGGLVAGGFLLRALLVVLVVALYAAPILLTWAAYRLFQRAGRQADLESVDGLLLARERHYSGGHLWLQPRAFSRLRIGLDDLGQRVLPGATAITLPRVGSLVKKGDPVAVIASGHRETSIPSPVDGKVVAVNRAVSRRPGLLNRSPYDRGWLFSVRPAGPEWSALPTGGAARDWFRGEERRLSRFMEHELAIAAADGGELLVSGPSALSRAQWEQLVSEFLRG